MTFAALLAIITRDRLSSNRGLITIATLYRVLINSDVPYIKMISEQFDRCHGTLLQYVEFLCSAVTPTTAYALLIPPLDDIVHRYHLDPEVGLSLSLSL